MQLPLSIAVWCVVIYSFRIALFGNPLHKLLVTTDARLLSRTEAIVHEGQAPPSDDPAAELLRRFSRLTLLELGAFILEMVLLIFFVLSDLLPRAMVWMCVALIGKNILVLAGSIYYARIQASRNELFGSLRALPGWLLWLDRISALLSGVAFLLLFAALNGLFQPA